MNRLSEIQVKRQRFLRYLYDHGNSSTLKIFDSLEVGRALGYTDDEAESIVRYLAEEGLVTIVGSSGKQDAIRLTQQGLRRVETASPDSHTNRDGTAPCQTDNNTGRDYQCRDRIHISGRMPKNRSNTILVNNETTRVGDADLRLLLELIVVLKQNKGGWMHRLDLKCTYQDLSRLRDRLEGSVENRRRDIIESDGSGRYRLSTPPELVTYDRDQLLNHLDEDVKNLAGQLP